MAKDYKKHLTPEQYEVCWNKGTDPRSPASTTTAKTRASTSASTVASACSALTKFDSGTGWPSSWTPIKEGSVEEEVDTSYGMVRTKVMRGRCGAHLGHMFDDGSNPTSPRYYINALSLLLAKKKGATTNG